MPEGRNALSPVHEAVTSRLADVDLSGALEEIWGLVRAANRHVEEQQPWVLAKGGTDDDARRLDDALYTLADTVRALAVLLTPYIPAAAGKILDAVGDPGADGWERAALGLLRAGTRVRQPEPLFPRVER